MQYKIHIDLSSVTEHQEKYKMMPFHGCYLSFHGFSDDEKKHMEESTEQQGLLYTTKFLVRKQVPFL